MLTIIQSTFFLLFCATSGLGVYLAHRVFVRGLRPGVGERILAILAALASVALSSLVYYMRLGTYCPPQINPSAASIVAAATGIGIAFVCLKVVAPDEEPVE